MKVRIPEPELFPDFWAAWLPYARNTDGRGLARETFRKHVLNGAEPQDIIDGAAWFLRNLSARDREYVPLSSTWLNRETYVDLAPKEREWKQRLEARQTERPSNVVHINPQPAQPSAFLRSWAAKTK